jgi:hypothetical protein
MVNQIYQDFEKISIHQPSKISRNFIQNYKRLMYTSKKKINTFDGFIGFSNNETNKIRLNGYVT